MNKKILESESTSNSYLNKLYRVEKFWTSPYDEMCLGCIHCGTRHHHINVRACKTLTCHPKYKKDRNWKRYRKRQYKEQ